MFYFSAISYRRPYFYWHKRHTPIITPPYFIPANPWSISARMRSQMSATRGKDSKGDEKVITTLCNCHCGGCCMLKVHIKGDILRFLQTSSHYRSKEMSQLCRSPMSWGLSLPCPSIRDCRKFQDADVQPVCRQVEGKQQADLCDGMSHKGRWRRPYWRVVSQV